jgi:hypothetical protein
MDGENLLFDFGSQTVDGFVDSDDLISLLDLALSHISAVHLLIVD